MIRLSNSNRGREGGEIKNQKINTDKNNAPFLNNDRPF